MNGRTAALLLLSALFCAQIAAPVFMIAQREKVLRHGKTFRFRCEPVDPTDGSRGSVAIWPESNTAPGPVDFASGQRVFVTVEADTNGFAQFTGARHDRPDGDAWIRTRVRWNYLKGRTYVDSTMNRFYMEESDAPRAETAWCEATLWNRPHHTAVVVARVYRGMAVIRDLEIDGRPIRDVLRDPEPR